MALKVMFISLGCDKNLVDAEKMLGILRKEGYAFTDDETEAEIIIINSCCFIGDAKEESINTILEMASLKENGKCKALIVTGCLTERYQNEFMKELPEVDGILGIASWQEIGRVVKDALEKKIPHVFFDKNSLPKTDAERVITTGGYYAHLKIAEGCDKCCTYCIIPKVRGRYRSVPMEELIKEAENLAKQGVRELILVAQETTLYGVDLYGEKTLPTLIQRLCEIPGIYWIRLQYCYPEEITDELIEVIASQPKVCHYLDIPIQHGADRILKRMGRRTNSIQIRQIVEKLRKEIPDIVLRTTVITGFPGETEDDFEELMEFVDEMEFERLGVFAYSQEEDTAAASMEDQIPEEIKQERRAQVMELQQEIAFEKSESMVGKILDVMIEGKVADENAYVGRTYMDAPGVDGYIFVQTGVELMSGDFVKVKVTGAVEYDLIGELSE